MFNTSGYKKSVTLSVLFFLLIQFSSFSQSNLAYSYVLPIVVTNPNATAISNVQLSFDMQTNVLVASNKMSQTANDILFQHKCQDLFFWMEDSSFNNLRTTFWIKIPSLDPGVDTVYMYYGNPNAPAINPYFSGDNVFVFFDDFNAPTINTAKWPIQIANNGGEVFYTTPLASTSGHYTFTANTTSNPNDDAGLFRPMPLGNYEAGTKMFLTNHPYTGGGSNFPDSDPLIGWVNTIGNKVIAANKCDDEFPSDKVWTNLGGGTGTTTQYNSSLDMRNAWNYTRIATYQNNAVAKRFQYMPFYSNSSVGSYTSASQLFNTETGTTVGFFLGSQAYQGLQIYFDFVFIRNTFAIEPTLALNVERPNMMCALTTSHNSPVCAGQTLNFSISYACNPGFVTTHTVTNNLGVDVTTNLNQISVPTVGSANSGVYTISDFVNGCLHQSMATIVVNDLPTVSASSGAVCSGGGITLNATGASSYQWSNGQNGAAIVVNPVADISLTVIGTDQNGCTNTAQSNIVVNPLPAITVNSETICDGETAVLIATTLENTVVWSNGQAGININVTPNTTSTYIATVTNANTGCSNQASGVVTVNNNPTIVVNTAQACESVPFTLSATGGVSYLWADEANNTYTSPSITQTLNNSVNYSLVVTDVNGCSAVQLVPVTIHPNPVADFQLTVIDSVCSYNALAINQSTGADMYSWKVNNQSVFSADLSISLSKSGSYPLELIATTNNGCKDTAIQTIKLSEDFYSTFYVPNSFSPNKDGINDVWSIESLCTSDFTCSIFDRWGNLITTLENAQSGWDGKNKNNEVLNDIYVYKLSYKDALTAENREQNGHIIVLK
ncbi:MAG: DUF2341 domain-containing protein [Bacteroidetes bacterium]|nr:DUF2341 domain-containing protein [Bacteroidota bacterium]